MSKKNARDSRTERAAEAVREQQQQEQRRRMLMVGGVVAVLLVVVVAGFWFMQSRDTTNDVVAAPAGTEEHGLTIGESGAPHEVVIYEDFHCVHCATLEEESAAELAELADDGKVLVEYRPVSFLSDYSERSTNALKVVMEESGPETAKVFHDLLFEHYDEASQNGDGLDDDELVELAVEAGAEEDAVRPGIEDLAHADWVEEATQAATDAGVQGTPTVLLDGEVYQGGSTMEEVAESLLETLQ